MIWSGRRRGLIIALLSGAAIGLVLANLVKQGVVTWATLETHKDGLAAAQSVVSITVVLVAAVLSYFRFFHGRTFSTRAELDLTVRVFSLPNGQLMHAISLALRNIGGAAIWDPQPVMSMTITDAEGPRHAGTIRVRLFWNGSDQSHFQ
jgi:hypothetical protein